MTQPLFLEARVEFEKTGAESQLPDDANEWPHEIMQELYKQVSAASDFAPHVVMDRVDGERAYAFGHIEIQNKTELQQGTDPASLSTAGVKMVRIPVIVKDRKLQPLDLLVTEDSKVLPLTEDRLRQAIFRPQAFDITGRGPGDQSMIGQLYPPYRQNYGGGGGGGVTVGASMGKEGSARGSLLEAILPTINRADFDRFLSKFASDAGLRAAYTANLLAAGDALGTIASYEDLGSSKLASTVLQNVKPSVAQLRKEAGSYILKTANHACWTPEEQVLDRGQAVKMLGAKVVLAADMTGAATMTAAEGVSDTDSPEKDQPELVTEFGLYKVQDEMGRHLVGYVFSNLIDIDGTALPISLFTNGSQMATQSDIVGVPAGTGGALFEGPPQGKGAFYHVLSNGKAEATIPMTVTSTLASPEQGGVTLQAETFDGRSIDVLVQPNLQMIVPSPDGDHLLVPDYFSWLPLDKAEETVLIGDPSGFDKQGEAARELFTVEVRSGGMDSFAVDGLAVSKLASDDRQFLSLDDTLFLLGGLGADLDYVQMKLGQAAASSRPVSVRVSHYIKTAGDRVEEAVKTASGHLQNFPNLRRDLVKEAALIPDPVAVDTVLSLGFLNPENLGLFVGYLPAIDEAQSKMCELLLAVRLGLRDVSAQALEKAIHATEDVIEGLKVVAFSGT